jgi:multimeric flavodoxin WrbA
MKVVAFNGSPPKDGNTGIIINHLFAELEKEVIMTMKALGENMAWLLKKLYG